MPDEPQRDDDAEDEVVDFLDDKDDDAQWGLEEQRHSRIASLPKKFCRFCNRPERFARDLQPTILRSYIKGLTFGLSGIFGPLKCICCGTSTYKMPGNIE